MSLPYPLSIPLFAQAQQNLLLREHEAEKSASSFATSIGSAISASTRRSLQAAGYGLTGLVLWQCKTGMGGRVVGEFAADTALSSTPDHSRGNTDGRPLLGMHGIRVGDILRVMVVASGASKKPIRDKTTDLSKAPEGVVTKASEKSICIAFGQSGVGDASKHDDEGVEELWSKKLWAVKIANDITYRRMRQTMQKMEKMNESEHTAFMRILFGDLAPSPPEYDTLGPIDFVDRSLNDSQKEAVRLSLASREIALIHGPPGTGKTHTLIELVLQMLRRNLRVLVCGPSNVSVDNIVERLSPHRLPIVRIGHPARLLPSVLDQSLETMTQNSDAAAIVKDIRKDIDNKQASIRKTRNGRERRAIYGELKDLRKEFRERESKCVDDLVRGSKVVLATLHGAGGYQLKNQRFDVVIIDEASQALEAQCWVPLLYASRAVLAGDHLQLPPTIKSLHSKPKKGQMQGNQLSGIDESLGVNSGQPEILAGISLETTLFDRLIYLHGKSIKKMLTVQYRMHDKIMSFPSDKLYGSKLIAADSVKARLLKDLPYEVEDTDDTREPLVFWDTQGGHFPEKTEDDDILKKGSLLGESKSNDMEAAIAARHVDNLVKAGVKPEDIAVVTPYNAQVALLSQLLKDKYPGVELGSVDGFQGREKEAVVISLVRSNSEHSVGFLAEKRRLNVAMTRPKRHLCVCGDSETISRGSQFLQHWMEFLEENADLRYPDTGDFI
ncbi:P-loop containing nucleoside triphosphate hydrolase protein [Elaphomyces granulatus]